MEREVERLEGEALVLERDWRRVPALMVFALTALPAYWIWGSVAAFYAILCAPCLVITALYLVGVRRAENRQALAELRKQLERPLAGEPGAPARP
jgi:hypothetical protein